MHRSILQTQMKSLMMKKEETSIQYPKFPHFLSVGTKFDTFNFQIQHVFC